MRSILYLFLLITSSAYCQEVEIGTIFTIEFNSFEKNMEFKIVSQKAYAGLIDISKFDSIVANNKPLENQILGVFAKEKFGNKVSPILILNSSLSKTLNYGLKIKLSQKREFQNTSTSPLYKGVKSKEYWPYDIEKIIFHDFEEISTGNTYRIDSTYVKNADKNIKSSEQEFKSYFKTIIEKFSNESKFKIEELLKYEKSINSKDVSLRHYWSLGNNIYPNTKGFKFANPLSFQKIECPYLNESNEYFYTKAQGDVKVVAFNWTASKPSELETGPDVDITPKFIQKYEFLTEVVSELLGKPMAIQQDKNSGIIDTNWHSTKGINAYLLRFRNYNEIRLYLYKD